MNRRPTPDARPKLLAIYADADAELAPFSCPASADCCHFARTGREPSVTAAEWDEIARAVRARGRTLPPPPTDGARTCPFLSKEDRCSIYESRPLGCRTYFCSRMTGPGAPRRAVLHALVPRLRTLAAQVAPVDSQPRTLSSWLRTAASGSGTSSGGRRGSKKRGRRPASGGGH